MSSNQELKRVQHRMHEFRRELAALGPEEVDFNALETAVQDICNGFGRTLMGEVLERADAHSPTVEINGEQ